MRRFPAIALLSLMPGLAMAQAPGAADDARPPAKLERIEVTAPNDVDERRESTAAKIVINRDEILRYGDSTVIDVMKRLPGVTVSGAGGRGAEIRMRGLGSGYTQILINGERMPPGFSLDAIAPDLIERIEVYRSATAEFSTQSIAGTINIVLRRAVSQRQRELKLGLTEENGAVSVNASAQAADRAGALSYTLPIAVNSFRFRSTQLSEQVGSDVAARPTLDYATRHDNRGHGENIGLSPKFNWEFAKDHTLLSESFVQLNRFHGDFGERSTTLLGAPPPYAVNDTTIDSRSSNARTNLTWVRRMGDESRIEAKLGAGLFRRASNAVFDASDSAGDFVLHRTVDSHVRDETLTSTGKYFFPVISAHTFSLGWDAARNRRIEDRVQLDRAPAGQPLFNIDESYDARVLRVAFFSQDEWQVTPRASLYLGLRWEGIDTRSLGNVVSEAHNRSGVSSPIVQALWKLPGTEKDQLRAGLARTYRAPNTFELVPRRYIANNNTATTSDFQGNPNLRPELAWGLDGAYEHYFAGGGIFSVSAFHRRVDDVILRELLDVNGTFITRPSNQGRATIRGLEIDTKLNLSNFFPAAPKVDLRANLARTWSRVDFLPPPDNRLDQQTRISGNLGFDYRFASPALAIGGNFSFKTGGPVRTSLTQTQYNSARRTLDLYASWKLAPAANLRVTLSNALQQDYLAVERFFDGGGALQLTTVTPSYLRLGALLELKL